MFSIVSVLVLGASVITQAPNSAALKSLKKTFAGHKSFEVRFTQQVRQDVFPDEAQKAVGFIKVKRPHYLKWVYEKPQKREISYDGKKLVIEQNGETQEHLTGGLSLEESFSFLWGELNPKELKIESTSKNGFRVVPLNRDEAQFKFIEVKVENGFVKEAIVYDHLDGQSLLRFDHWKLK
jgi:outer membrane lipoprotein-sorting protein